MFSFMCVCGLIYGAITRFRLATASCCEMSWNAGVYTPVYLPTPKTGNYFGSNYTLYSYFDARSNKGPFQKSKGCTSPPVIFVPGHLGQYQQGRSIGAHGFRLGHVKERKPEEGSADFLQAHYMKDNWESFYGTSETVDPTALKYLMKYETYTIDFDEEPSMLHASYLERQAEFLINSIDHVLKDRCDGRYQKVVLVGHSAGGVVSRSIFAHPNYEKLFGRDSVVETIITLATPHEKSPLMLDPSFSHFYTHMHSFWSNSSNTSPGGPLHSTFLISIAGGERDETVPSHLSDTTSRVPSSISVLAPFLAKFRRRAEDGCSCGTDHRAIAWCREILTPVRDVILSSVSTIASEIQLGAEEKRAHYERTMSLSSLSTTISGSQMKKPLLLGEMKTIPFLPFSEQISNDSLMFTRSLTFPVDFLRTCTSSQALEMLLILWFVVGILSLINFPPLISLVAIPVLVGGYSLSLDPTTTYQSLVLALQSLVLAGAANLPFLLLPSKKVPILHMPTIALYVGVVAHLANIAMSGKLGNIIYLRQYQIYQLGKIGPFILHIKYSRQRIRSEKIPKDVYFAQAAICTVLAANYGEAFNVIDIILLAAMLDVYLLLKCDGYERHMRENPHPRENPQRNSNPTSDHSAARTRAFQHPSPPRSGKKRERSRKKDN